MLVELKYNTYDQLEFGIYDANENPMTGIDGLPYRLTVKELTDDDDESDDGALIIKGGTIDGYTITVTFEQTDTKIEKKQYKCDVRYGAVGQKGNTEIFYIEIKDTVTKV